MNIRPECRLIESIWVDFAVKFVKAPVCRASVVSMFGEVGFECFDGHPGVAEVFTDDSVGAGWCAPDALLKVTEMVGVADDAIVLTVVVVQ